MTTPLGAILCGVLQGTPAVSVQPELLLDVATGPDSAPTLLIDVRANDPVPGNISNPVIVEGVAGGSVAVVANQLELTHNGAGIYVINYDSTIGALTTPGVATAVITPPVVAGVPPTFGTSFQLSENSNVARHVLPAFGKLECRERYANDTGEFV